VNADFQKGEEDLRSAFSFQAAALIDEVMIAPSFNRNAVRGFWPGLGAKSLASPDMAPIDPTAVAQPTASSTYSNQLTMLAHRLLHPRLQEIFNDKSFSRIAKALSRSS
jgi:hypothetical protein